jgi:hypothetical protein
MQPKLHGGISEVDFRKDSAAGQATFAIVGKWCNKNAQPQYPCASSGINGWKGSWILR